MLDWLFTWAHFCIAHHNPNPSRYYITEVRNTADRSLTDFGKQVYKRKIDLGISQQELVQMIRNKTGKYMDEQYLRKILTGQRKSEVTERAIKEVLGIWKEWGAVTPHSVGRLFSFLLAGRLRQGTSCCGLAGLGSSTVAQYLGCRTCRTGACLLCVGHSTTTFRIIPV